MCIGSEQESEKIVAGLSQRKEPEGSDHNEEEITGRAEVLEQVPNGEKCNEVELANVSQTAEISEFSVEEHLLYERRYDEGYDLVDPRYEMWLHQERGIIPVSTSPQSTPSPSTTSHNSLLTAMDVVSNSEAPR